MNFSDTEFFPPRRKTRPVKVGRLTIGGDAAIAVQSMTKTDTRDVEKTVEQIQQMEAAGLRNCPPGRAGHRSRQGAAGDSQALP